MKPAVGFTLPSAGLSPAPCVRKNAEREMSRTTFRARAPFAGFGLLLQLFRAHTRSVSDHSQFPIISESEVCDGVYFFCLARLPIPESETDCCEPVALSKIIRVPVSS